ncbi:recombination directionality factor [Streptosporangium sp. NPDC003464]
MPIIELQRRMRQLGEIRIGHTVDTGRVSEKTGKPILRPAKLNRFRLTSASRPLLEEVASLYGGTVQAWTPANGGPAEWEVYTDADRLPVLVPPREPVTQWYELYKGSKCVRRCDGVTEQKSDKPCMCNPDQRACQITTRLNVMLRDVPGLGVWLLTSHGYYAAVELPEVAQFLAATRGYVDAWLTMEEKQVVRDDGQTARFMVPKLDVQVTPAQLLAGEGGVALEAAGQGQRASVAGGSRTAIEAPKPVAPGAEDFIAAAEGSVSLEDLSTNLAAAQRAGFAVNLQDPADPVALAFMRRRDALMNPPPAAVAPPAPAAAAAQELPDADALWMQIVSAWPGTTTELEQTFLGAMGGPHYEASEADLDAFLKLVKAGRFNTPAPAAQGSDEVPF